MQRSETSPVREHIVDRAVALTFMASATLLRQLAAPARAVASSLCCLHVSLSPCETFRPLRLEDLCRSQRPPTKNLSLSPCLPVNLFSRRDRHPKRSKRGGRGPHRGPSCASQAAMSSIRTMSEVRTFRPVMPRLCPRPATIRAGNQAGSPPAEGRLQRAPWMRPTHEQSVRSFSLQLA